jgi:type I restriction enzyme S subunit
MNKNIEEHINILSGYPFNSKLFNNKQLGTPLIRIRDLEKIASDTYFNGDFQDVYLMNKNDILIGMDGDFLCVKWKGKPSLLNQRICKITTNGLLNKDYLFHNLQKKLDYIHFRTAGTTVKHLSVKDIKKIDIYFPSLKEQEKIADILSTADEKIEAIATQIEKYETLKKGLLQKLLSEGIGHTEFKDSELGRMPVGWEITTVGKSSKNFDGQRVPLKSEDRQEIQGVYPYYGAQGIIDYVNDYIFDGKYLLVAEDGENVKGQKYDIAFVVNGKFWVNNHAHILQATKDMNLYFISSILNHINIIKYVTGTGQPKLNKAQLNSIKIPLPPLEEQKQIANILSTADKKLEVLRAKKQMYETLKQGLMQKLLTGEVRV